MITLEQLLLRRRVLAVSRKRHRPRTLPIATPPRAAILQHTALLHGISRELDAAVADELAAMGLGPVRTDAADGDAGAPRGLGGLAARLDRLVARILQRKQFVVALDGVAANVAGHTREQFQRQVTAALGVDLPNSDPDFHRVFRDFRAKNTALIKTMAEDKVSRVRRVLREAGAGTRVEDVAERLRAETGITERHAALVARDQVLKLNGQVTEQRHREAGITHAVWRTSKDERVRSAHRAMEGVRFAYASPPMIGGHPTLPGGGVQCRCVAEPVIEGFDDAPALTPRAPAAPARPRALTVVAHRHPTRLGVSTGVSTLAPEPDRRGEPPTFLRFDPGKMSAALVVPPASTPGAVRQPSPADQSTVRAQGREILMEYGLPGAPTHPGLKRTGAASFEVYEVHDDNALNGIHGMLTPQGKMVMSETHHNRLVSYVNRAANNATATAPPEEEDAMLTYLHETLHEHSNVGAVAEKGIPRDIEESMTELSARRILRDKYGSTGRAAQHLGGGAADKSRAYDTNIARLRGVVHGALERLARQRGLLPAPSLADVDAAFDAAALGYKQLAAAGPTALTKADVVGTFVRALKNHLPPGLNDGPALGALTRALSTYTPPPPSTQGTP